jgi:hypothetical protein
MIPLAKIANNLEIICVASAVSRYLKDLCIAVLKKVRYALCPMPTEAYARRVPHVTEKGYSNKSITFPIMSCKITIIKFVERNKILPTNQ